MLANAFIAFGLWLLGFLLGCFGLWRFLCHDNAALFFMSLIAAWLSGGLGAMVLLTP